MIRSVGKTMWTCQQRYILTAVIVVLAILLGFRYLANPTYVSDPQPLEGPRAGELVTRLDPNTASADDLSALPLLGVKKAEEIVTYRERFLQEHPDQAAFAKPDDLQNVKGIGPATVQRLREYFVFPGEAATRP